MILLGYHQALQRLLERNRAHKQYSARLPPWLDRLSHFDVNVQYTAGTIIPLTDYLSRHPIAYDDKFEAEQTNNEQDGIEAEEEIVTNQTYGLFDFNRMNGSTTRYIGKPALARKKHQSQQGKDTHEQNQANHSLETTTPPNSVNSIKASNFLSKSKMTKCI